MLNHHVWWSHCVPFLFGRIGIGTRDFTGWRSSQLRHCCKWKTATCWALFSFGAPSNPLPSGCRVHPDQGGGHQQCPGCEVLCLLARSPKQCAWSASVWGVSHCKNVQPNHSRGKLAAQGIQILFSLHQIGDTIGDMEGSSSERPVIIGGQRGCLHFRWLHH